MTRLIFILITLTTLLNGSYFWLNRVGLINSASFDLLVEKNSDFNQRSIAYIKNPETITPEIEASFKQEHLLYKKQLYEHLYTNSTVSLILKSLKYIVYLIFLALICLEALRSENTRKLGGPSLLFGMIVIIYSALSFINFGMAGVIAGFSSCVFLAVLLFSAASLKLKDLRYFSVLMLSTLGLLLLIAPLELWKGIQVFNTNSFLGKRMTGFMDQPNTMGIYVICIVSFFVAWFRSEINRPVFILLCLGTLALIIFSGSNTAAVVFCAFLIAEYLQNNKSNPLRTPQWSLTLLAFVIVILFLTQGRPLMESMAGRLEKYQLYFSLDLSYLKLLFGHGIGAGSNTLLQLQSLLASQHPVSLPIRFSIDSTPLLIIIQTGVIGCTLFYGLMTYALIKVRRFRSTYLVFILCSMTINIIEVFPLNIVLALLLSAGLLPAVQKSSAGDGYSRIEH